jgi:hypothetical protein
VSGEDWILVLAFVVFVAGAMGYSYGEKNGRSSR